MDDNPMRLAWSLLGSLAGAITALSFRPYKTMTKAEIGLSLFVGFSFSTFVTPLALSWFFDTDADSFEIRVLGGAFYIMATGSNLLIPLAVEKVAIMAGFRTKEDI